MSGATFGRKGAAPDPDLAARRAAFLAAERARPKVAPTVEDDFGRKAERPYVSRKTTSTAYLLWFFFAGVGGHRHYLGFRITAVIQMLLTPLGYAMLWSKSPAGLLLVPAAGIWILVDAFLIPGMVAKANERARESSFATTFA